MKNLFKKEEFLLDEVIFQGRNKEYGAYDLRYQSDKMLTKAMFIGVAFFGSVSIIPLVTSLFKEEPKATVEVVARPMDIENIEKKEDEKPLPEKSITPPKPQKVNTVDSRVPDPKRNATNESSVPTNEESLNAIRGLETIQGKSPDIRLNPSSNEMNNSGNTGEVKFEKPVIIDDSPKTKVDVSADFIGGIDAFRNKVMSSFDISEFEESNEKLSTEITFVVEKDGSISNIKASGKDDAFNKETIRAIKSIKGKWTPAKIDGRPVRSYFRFPVSVVFN